VGDGLIAGRYRLHDRLGVGGMSEVWSADDEELGRRVAIKLLAPEADPARFEREARAAASLAHPNICQVYDYDRAEDGRRFIVLEYLPGGTLEDRLAGRKPLPDEDAARIAREVAAGTVVNRPPTVPDRTAPAPPPAPPVRADDDGRHDPARDRRGAAAADGGAAATPASSAATTYTEPSTDTYIDTTATTAPPDTTTTAPSPP
jgi:hypothetical protein